MSSPAQEMNDAPLLPGTDASLYNPDIILSLDEDLVCGICRNVIQTASQPSEGDSHIFCLGCLTQALATKSGCPICCIPATPDTITRVGFIDRRINNLQAKCYAHKSGCAWEGAFRDLREVHWPTECALHGEACPLCEEMIPAVKHREHTSSHCPKTRLTCTMCNAAVIRANVQAHLGVCPEAEVPCPAPCGATLLRRLVAPHLRSDCLEAAVPCLVEGCTATVRRRDMDDHLTSDPTGHLTLAIRDLRRLRDLPELRDLADLTAELRGLKGTLKKVETSVYGPRPVVVFDCGSRAEFEALQDAYPTGSSVDKDFTACGIDWRAHVYPCGHDDYDDYISAFVGPVGASLPTGWAELRYKCLFELFVDGASVSHRVDDRIAEPPRPGRYGWFKFAEAEAVRGANHVQFVVSLLQANVIVDAPAEAEPPAEDRRPETSVGLSMYAVAHLLLFVGLFAILRRRPAS